MCVIIVAGKKTDILVEMGINNGANMIGSDGNEEFFKKNSGPGKIYSELPTCTVRGTKVPCFICWSPNGSIMFKIPKKVLEDI